MPALLLANIDIPEALDEEFNAWYDTEHVPERSAIPDFGPITRWELVSGSLPRFLALFEGSSLETFNSGAYLALKQAGATPWTSRLQGQFTRLIRGIFEEAADYGGSGGIASYCVVALTTVPEAMTNDYREWNDNEHGPLVSSVPGVVRMRRFERHDAEPAHLSILELVAPDVIHGVEYGEAKMKSLGQELRDVWEREQGLYAALEGYRK